MLAIVTIAQVSRTLRDLTPEQQELHEQFMRDLRAVWWGASLFWISWALGAVVATLVALQAATQAALGALVDSRVVACTTLLTLDTRQDFAAAMSPPPVRTVM